MPHFFTLFDLHNKPLEGNCKDYKQTLRKIHNESWKVLEESTGIPWRTLQAIALRNPSEAEIKKNTRLKLEKVASHWGIKYDDLFVEIDNHKLEASALEELESFDDIIAETKIYLDKAKEKAPDVFREFLEIATQTKFLFRDSIEALINDYLMATPHELNGLGKIPITNFVKRCCEYEKNNVIKRITNKLIDENLLLDIKTLLYFAIAMADNEFPNQASELMEVAKNKATSFINR